MVFRYGKIINSGRGVMKRSQRFHTGTDSFSINGIYPDGFYSSRAIAPIRICLLSGVGCVDHGGALTVEVLPTKELFHVPILVPGGPGNVPTTPDSVC